MYVGLISNQDKDKNLEYTKEMTKFILSKNITPILFDDFKKYIHLDGVMFSEKEFLYQNSEFIIILGGDGTILRWSEQIAKHNKNIIGINKGHLGYLTDVDKDYAFSAIESVINKDFRTEKRMMLEVIVNGNSYLALNEANVSSGNIGRMVKLGIDINGSFVDSFSSDGLIISTPTGSTAYNLSAGGPIIKPDLELIAITYVCPHAIFSRPYVISANDVVKVSLASEDDKAFLSLDGKNNIPIKYKDELIIKKSSYCTNIIKTDNLNFYDILRKKMFEKR